VNAPAFLDELNAAGVRLSQSGDDLRFATNPGVSIAPFRDRIVANKPALVAALGLQEQIIQAATAATAAFDRRLYDRLWADWHAFEAEGPRT
jgi:hypothetical protein